MKTTLYTMLFVLLTTAVIAQQKTITGIVSEDGGPLPGANIMVKGTTTGTQTDFDGKYNITATAQDILVFSCVGFKIKEVKVNDQTEINVQLESDSSLEEVVVIAQGIRTEKEAVGYAVSTVTSQMLQGKANGVRTRGYSPFNSEQPIAPTSISDNRFITTSSSSDVIYVVDGVPVDPSLNRIIEEMPSSQVSHKVTHSPARAKKLFGDLGGRHCIVISTSDGNYRIENDESYKALKESQFKSVAYDPLSTFSIDVDRAGYSNIRRMINNGQEIPVDAVKIEEMINYFNYSYDAPVDGKPFAVHTEVAQTPWNKETQLVRIGLKGKDMEMDKLPPSNLTFLIDVSGSMSAQNKLPLLKSAFRILVNQLRKEDKVSIVVYAGAAGVVLEPTSGDKKQTIMDAIYNLNAGGSTAGGEGIELAYKLAEANYLKSGNNRVILATDGDFNVGMSSDSAMENLIKKKRTSGVFLTCVGFGMGNYKDSKMETLADKGNGNYAYIDTMQEANKFLGKEFGGTLHTIAKDVKLQVEFNPAVVKSYRLIGYENRMLASEDFIDDTKDAGEIGVGHTVTALYEVVPLQAGFNPVGGAPLKYTTSSTTSTAELLTVKFRYKEPNGSKSKLFEHVVLNESSAMTMASDDLKFVAAVVMFGMQLRDSKFVTAISEEQIITLAESGRGVDDEGYRAEFIRLMKLR